MAELVFSKLYTDASSLNSVCIGNEPDNTLSKFFIEANQQCNDLSSVTLSNYDQVVWERREPLMTSQDVNLLGIKTFPQIGSIGFYRLKYEPKSLVIAPIYSNDDNRKYPAPLLSVTDNGTSWHVQVRNPSDTIYDCFRIVVRSGYFAEEYITYENSLSIPAPIESGIYAVSAFGYINELCVSDESAITYVSTMDITAVVLADENGNAILFGDTIISI